MMLQIGGNNTSQTSSLILIISLKDRGKSLDQDCILLIILHVSPSFPKTSIWFPLSQARTMTAADALPRPPSIKAQSQPCLIRAYKGHRDTCHLLPKSSLLRL